MKRIITLISMFLFAGGILMAQTTTPKLSYEMVIRDAQTNDLLVNQDVSVTVSVYNLSNMEAPLYTEDLDLTTDNNGILIVAFGEDVNWQEQGVNWMNAEIHFEIDYSGDYTGHISHVDRVFAVPYALQSPNSDLLTTDNIVEYISGINFQNDVRRILKAYHENTYGLEEDWVDTFKHYLMSHQDKITEIILSYAPRVDSADIWHTYNTVKGNEVAMHNGMEVLKQYAKDNMAAAKEIMMHYLSEEFTAENQADLQQAVNKMKNNNTEVYELFKTYLEVMVKEYLEDNHYVRKTDCPDFQICE